MFNPKGVLRPTLSGVLGVLAVAAAVAIAAPASADGVTDFYKGKTITMTMGTRPGGSFQIYGQLFATHMPQYIPGKPTIVPAFMPGAGGTKAANYLYAAAAQDGSQLLLSHALPLAEKLRPKGLKFKSDKFQWLGSFSAITQLLTLWHEAPVKSLDDAKKKQAILSAFAKNHLTYQWASMVNSTLGTKFKIVTGFRGGAKNNLAMQQGEAHGWTPSWGNLNGTKPQWLRDKKVNLLIIFAFKRLPELPNVPTLLELVQPKDKPVVEFMIAGTPIARSLAVGPGVPADRVAALRTAFAKTVKDPSFLAEAKKRKLLIQPRKWQETEALVKKIVGASPELVARVKQATGLSK
jgi:tripartite-type tricarboxylate transporter receptor subunit TctC